MQYTLRQLSVFLAIAHHDNVTQAAAELAMTQSAASTALRELELRYDLKLFDRVGKRLQLNEQGKLLRPKAEALMAQAAELELSLKGHGDIGDLRVGATLTIGNYLAIAIMAEFMASHPQARTSLVVENTAAITQKVKNFELDIGLIEGELEDTDLHLVHWRDDELVCFCAPHHPYAAKSELFDADLIDAQWIVREQGSGTRQAFDRALSGMHSSLNLRLELQHTEGIKRAVEAGLGVGCLSRICLKEAFERGSLVPLPAWEKDWSRSFYFAYRRDKYLSAGVNSWIAHCKSQNP